MSAPNVVPFVVTNRTGNDIASVVCRWFVVSLPRATVTGCSPKAKAASRVALLDWRNGVRTFSATFCKRTSQSYFIGALAAAPGSVAMLAHRRMVFRAVLARWRFRFQAGLEFFPFACSHHFYVSDVRSA